MEATKDGGEGGRPCSQSPSAPVRRTCSTGALVAFLFVFLVFGVFVGLFLGESEGPRGRDRRDAPVSCDPVPVPVPVPSAYLVQEEHQFLETVQLRGLKYDSALQNLNSGYYIVLSSIMRTTVSPDPPLPLRWSLLFSC